VPIQIVAAIIGVWMAHIMFAMPVIEVSAHLREGTSQLLAEFIATIGLLGTIVGATRFAPSSAPILVGLYITGAYWFTASTAFANPAVTIARAFTDSFSGIAPTSVPGFIAAQLAATVGAALCLPRLFDGSGAGRVSQVRE
jgi:glycerol uptake facilitator-like aquaporin